MTDLAANEPLNAEEEARVRDFYERRTTRLNMGPSVLIPRLLATLDAARAALLADTPSVEPTPAGIVPLVLDSSWVDPRSRPSVEPAGLEEVLAAMPRDWRPVIVIQRGSTDRPLDRTWLATAEDVDDERVGRIGSGPTPEASLRALAALLPTQASDSPEKP